MHKIQADNYPILVGEQVFSNLSSFIKKKYAECKIFILVDENSMNFCMPELIVQVEAFKNAEVIEIGSGEENKNLEICVQIWRVLTELKADRKSLLVNLGGGVISDMGGFIASTFKRGIDFLNIPTTLLSQVDASVGGKTGVDLDSIKNQVGLFSNPVAVYVYPGFLKTLSKREILSGFAEIIKHGLIADSNYWEKIKKMDFTSNKAWEKMIYTSILIKNNIVSEDPYEQDLRKNLNFGHTVGHALETYYLEEKDSRLLHGEAIAVGMICESYLSHVKTGLSAEALEDITNTILDLYPALVIEEISYHRLMELMLHDKKNEKDYIHFSLLKSIGEGVNNKKCSADQIIDSFKYYQQKISINKKD